MRCTVLLVALVCAHIGISQAWGEEGHKIVAQIANDRLTSTAAGVVAQFLGSQTMMDVAPDPDDYDHSPAGRWSAPCHYCNLPRGATSFSMQLDCQGFCVAKSIGNYTNILSTTQSQPSACQFAYGDEPCALVFMIHFMGDIHQPLHVGWGDDEGGNTVEVTWFGSPTNLHEVWDDKIIERWNSDQNSAVQELEQWISTNAAQVAQWQQTMDPVAIADESFAYVRNAVYNFTSKALSTEYYNQHLPIVKLRLAAAGVRLAQALNTILVGNDNNNADDAFNNNVVSMPARQKELASAFNRDLVGQRMKSMLRTRLRIA